jgi:ADP-ribose pyrophosphatase
VTPGQRLDRYDQVRAERPGRFANPPGAAYEIIFDRPAQLACEAEHGPMGVVFEDRFFIVLRDTVRFADGRVGPYIRMLGAADGTGAAVLPVLADGRVLLVRHFRHEQRDWCWEIPRGFPEPGEDGPATAARELAEEVGVRVTGLEVLGRLGLDEICLARLAAADLPADLPAGAAEEGIDAIRLVTAGELTGMIAEGVVTDGFLLAAYAFATARGVLSGPSGTTPPR